MSSRLKRIKVVKKVMNWLQTTTNEKCSAIQKGLEWGGESSRVGRFEEEKIKVYLIELG